MPEVPTKGNKGWSRRRILLVGGAVALSGGVITLGVRLLQTQQVPRDIKLVLEMLVQARELEGVLHLGRRFLKQNPVEDNMERLVSRLMPDPHLLDNIPFAGDRVIRIQLRKKIEQDIEQEELITVDGWLLPVTEARMYGLASLLTPAS